MTRWFILCSAEALVQTKCFLQWRPTNTGPELEDSEWLSADIYNSHTLTHSVIPGKVVDFLEVVKTAQDVRLEVRPRPHEVEVVTVGVNLKSHHNHELKPGTELEVLKIVFLLPLLLTTPRSLLRGRPLLLLPWKIHRQCNWSKINLSSQLVSKPLPSSSPQLLSFIFYRLSPFRVMGGAGANPSSNWVRVENAMNSSLLHHRSLSPSTLGSIQCEQFTPYSICICVLLDWSKMAQYLDKPTEKHGENSTQEERESNQVVPRPLLWHPLIGRTTVNPPPPSPKCQPVRNYWFRRPPTFI